MDQRSGTSLFQQKLRHRVSPGHVLRDDLANLVLVEIHVTKHRAALVGQPVPWLFESQVTERANDMAERGDKWLRRGARPPPPAPAGRGRLSPRVRGGWV